MNVDELLTAATDGTIGIADLDAVAASLSKGRGDSYTELMILGRAGAKRFRSLVESFLNTPQDPMLARAAIYALCDCWHDTDMYLPKIREFCRGVSWDDDADVKLKAISTAGEFLSTHMDTDLGQCLLDTAENEEDEIIRDAARSAIARAMGIPWHEIPSPKKLADGSAAIPDEIVLAFRKRVEQKP